MGKIGTIFLLALLVLSSCKLKEEEDTGGDITDPSGNGVSSIKIISPNGGETWMEGSAYEIKWTAKGTSFVKIQFSVDNGTSWSLIADSVKNTGVYTWFPIPNLISNQCLVSISASDGKTFDLSDKPFSIIKNSNESLKINTPVGNETWEAGTAKSITWYSSGIDSVKLEYTTNNGNNWNFIAVDRKNTGIYYWEPVPNTPSTLAKVRISDAKDGTPSAESPATFSILPEPKIKVISPNGGEKLLSGGSRKIEWISENIEEVKIAYTTNNGAAWHTIVEKTPSLGFYNWVNIPNLNSQLCKIRIYDAKDGEPSDVSDSVFTITNQVTQNIEITSPNGGERWQAGTAQTITWNSSGIQKVKIEFTSNNGLTWNEVINNQPNTGGYEWSVPNSLSTQCLIKISDAADGEPVDESNSTFRIVPKPDLKLIRPNGGEVWTAGVLDTIKWMSIGVENVLIEYSPNNGLNWFEIVLKTPSDGEYPYSFSAPSSLYKIKIKDAESGFPVDESDGTFTVLPEPKISVITPNGGEDWYSGSSDNIKWTSINIENVKIEYTTNNGATWQTIVSSTESDGVYSWNNIPNASSLLCRVRISDAKDGIPADISDENFSITYPGNQLITVTAPNGGESLTAGESFNITWNAAGINNVKIEYTVNNGISWNTIVASTPSDGFYTWTQVPATASTNCKIRISDAADGAPSDDSDSFFTILPEPSIQVVDPNGGESWVFGTNETIRWTSSNIENVKIEYTTNGGGNWNLITASYPSIGSYLWTSIPNVNSEQCKIRISDADDGLPSDLSDNNFRISNQVIQTIRLISPNGGEKWQAGTPKNITWDSRGITNVTIEFTTNNGITWNNIATNIESSGAYEWNIPSTINSVQCKVKVKNALTGEPSDESNSIFTIQPIQTTPEILHPANGEEILAGERFNIEWRSSGIEFVRIEYNYRDVSVPEYWTLVADSVPSNSNGISSTYQTTFSIVSDNYVVRIMDASDRTPVGYSGIFKVREAPTIKVLSPNGNEKWIVGNQYQIKWEATNVVNVKVEISYNGGGDWHLITPTTPNDGSIDVYRPGTQHLPGKPNYADSTENAFIRISDVDGTPSDISDKRFSIRKNDDPNYKFIQVLAPNGGEQFDFGNPPPLHIIWNSNGVDDVNIDYSLDNGKNWTNLVSNYPSTGAYTTWNYSAIASGQVKIRVIDASNSAIRDESDGYFYINANKPGGLRIFNSGGSANKRARK